jgi:hypothetical protein
MERGKRGHRCTETRTDRPPTRRAGRGGLAGERSQLAAEVIHRLIQRAGYVKLHAARWPAGDAAPDARASAALLLLQHELAETRERKAVSLTIVQNVQLSLGAEQGDRGGSSDALRIDLDTA